MNIHVEVIQIMNFIKLLSIFIFIILTEQRDSLHLCLCHINSTWNLEEYKTMNFWLSQLKWHASFIPLSNFFLLVCICVSNFKLNGQDIDW